MPVAADSYIPSIIRLMARIWSGAVMGGRHLYACNLLKTGDVSELGDASGADDSDF